MSKEIDWYERRYELEEGMIFRNVHGELVKLDRSVPGDGTKWYVADWWNGWSYMDSTIEPGELSGEPLSEEQFKALLRDVASSSAGA